MGRVSDRQKYIQSPALDMMRSLKIRPAEFFSLQYADQIAGQIEKDYGFYIFDIICDKSDAENGKIVGCGVPNHPEPDRGTSMYQVHRGQVAYFKREFGHDAERHDLDYRWPGADLLHAVAANVIIAAICDIIIKQHPLSKTRWDWREFSPGSL